MCVWRSSKIIDKGVFGAICTNLKVSSTKSVDNIMDPATPKVVTCCKAPLICCDPNSYKEYLLTKSSRGPSTEAINYDLGHRLYLSPISHCGITASL
jgi:hypothetical protein